MKCLLFGENDQYLPSLAEINEEGKKILSKPEIQKGYNYRFYEPKRDNKRLL